MKRPFLYRSFLPGHTPDLSTQVDGRKMTSGLSKDDLGGRLAARTDARRERADARSVTLYASTAAALLLLVLALRLPTGSGASDFTAVEAAQEVVAMQEIVPTKQETTPPPPPAPPVPVEVANDVIIEDEVDFDATLDFEETLEVAGPPAPSEGDAPPEEEPEVFVAVEQMPEIIGGRAQLMSDVNYPRFAVKAGIQGTVVVQVVVEADGSVRDPQVVRSAGALLDEAAVEAVMKQRFRPGKQRDRPVPVRMAIPVSFRLT
jgi:protein TonB